MFSFYLDVDTEKQLISQSPVGVVPCVKYWQAEECPEKHLRAQRKHKKRGNYQINPRKRKIILSGVQRMCVSNVCDERLDKAS